MTIAEYIKIDEFDEHEFIVYIKQNWELAKETMAQFGCGTGSADYLMCLWCERSFKLFALDVLKEKGVPFNEANSLVRDIDHNEIHRMVKDIIEELGLK